jgi:hypothetical protein
MGRPAGKWPHFALENLEDSLYRLKELEDKASKAQDAIIVGDSEGALRHLSDVRVEALKCVENLVRSRIGKYEQQERSPRWKPTEERTAQAVNQVMATRRP